MKDLRKTLRSAMRSTASPSAGKSAPPSRAAALALAAALAAFHAQGESATGTAASPARVDVRTGTCRAVAPAEVRYSPLWCGTAEAGSRAVVELVADGVATAVAEPAPGAEGAAALPAASGQVVTLVHRVYSSEGAEIGEPLVREVAIGDGATSSGATRADTRAASFQEAVSSDGFADLAYSTEWATGAASVSISAVRTRLLDGTPATSAATNALFTANASAEGLFRMKALGGGWRILLAISDPRGRPLYGPLAADYFLRPAGLKVILR